MPLSIFAVVGAGVNASNFVLKLKRSDLRIDPQIRMVDLFTREEDLC